MLLRKDVCFFCWDLCLILISPQWASSGSRRNSQKKTVCLFAQEMDYLISIFKEVKTNTARHGLCVVKWTLRSGSQRSGIDTNTDRFKWDLSSQCTQTLQTPKSKFPTLHFGVFKDPARNFSSHFLYYYPMIWNLAYLGQMFFREITEIPPTSTCFSFPELSNCHYS